MKRLEIGIVGLGTAGSAAALYLARAGHLVTIHERVPVPGAVGAGLILQPVGQAVLAELGLYERVVARGAPLANLHVVTSGGRQLLDLRYARAGRGHGFGLHRGVLFAALTDALAAAGVAVHCGHEVTGLRAAGDRSTLVDARGRALGSYDLVVIADGARSRLRDETDAALRRRQARTYPWGALWFVGHDHARRHDGQLYQVVDGPRRMLGLLPTGLGPDGEVPLASLFWSLRGDGVAAWRARFDDWRAEVVRMAPPAAALVEQIGSPDQVTFASYQDVVLEPWHTRNTVYIGDAAHATSPQLGQGANLALCDAQALAAALATHARVPEALAAYSRRRRAHLAFYQRASRWLTPFFQGDSTACGLLRDLGLPIGARIPWVYRQMVLTMCGRKLGPFTAMPEPPSLLSAGPYGKLPLAASPP